MEGRINSQAKAGTVWINEVAMSLNYDEDINAFVSERHSGRLLEKGRSIPSDNFDVVRSEIRNATQTGEGGSSSYQIGYIYHVSSLHDE